MENQNLCNTMLIILAPHLSLLRGLEATERQRRIRELWMFPFFVDEVVREGDFKFPPVLQRKFKSRVICYLIRHRLKFKKEILKVLFILISYTFSVRLFLDLSAHNLKCCPESLCAAVTVTLHSCQRLFLSIVFDGHPRPMK